MAIASRGTCVALIPHVARIVHTSVTLNCTHTDSRVAQRRAKGDDDMEMMNRMRALVRDDSGQDMLEYALLTALIALVAVGAIKTAGVQVSAIFGKITTELTPAS